MKQRPPVKFAGNGISPEDTLRLLATVKPPSGIAGRIEARLAMQIADAEDIRRRPWLISFVTAYPRAIAASLTVCSLLGGGAGLYHAHKATTLPPPIRITPGSMGSAGAIRVAPAGVLPPAATGPKVAPKTVHGRAVVQAGVKPRPKGVGVPSTLPPPEKISTAEQ